MTNKLDLKEFLIIEGLKRREKEIFDYVFNFYYSSLCAFSMQYIENRDSVEDLVQDFFVHLWMEAPRLQIRSSLKAYLFTAIKNRCLDYQKHQKITERYRQFILYSGENQEDFADHYFAESELRLVIRSSLNKLAPRCREIFELSRVDGLSNQEISVKLNISKQTVERQISNSLKVLKKELAEFLPAWILIWLIG